MATTHRLTPGATPLYTFVPYQQQIGASTTQGSSTNKGIVPTASNGDTELSAMRSRAIEIPLPSGFLHMEKTYPAEKQIPYSEHRTYGPAAPADMRAVKVSLLPEDLAAAGWHRAGGSSSVASGIERAQAFAAGVRAAKEAIATIKYDCESAGQPWSIRDVKIKGE